MWANINARQPVLCIGFRELYGFTVWLLTNPISRNPVCMSWSYNKVEYNRNLDRTSTNNLYLKEKLWYQMHINWIDLTGTSLHFQQHWSKWLSSSFLPSLAFFLSNTTVWISMSIVALIQVSVWQQVCRVK